MNQYERYLSYLPEIQKLQSESFVTSELSVNEIINHLKKAKNSKAFLAITSFMASFYTGVNATNGMDDIRFYTSILISMGLLCTSLINSGRFLELQDDLRQYESLKRHEIYQEIKNILSNKEFAKVFLRLYPEVSILSLDNVNCYSVEDLQQLKKNLEDVRNNKEKELLTLRAK